MKQLVFPYQVTCTHFYPDGKIERVRYGQYEVINIIQKNGCDIKSCCCGGFMTMEYHDLSEVTKIDGTKVVFDQPFEKTLCKKL